MTRQLYALFLCVIGLPREGKPISAGLEEKDSFHSHPYVTNDPFRLFAL